MVPGYYVNPSGATSVGSERIDYRELHLKDPETAKAWKGRIYCECVLVCLNWLAIVLYLIIFGLGLQIDNEDVYNDLSIYY